MQGGTPVYIREGRVYPGGGFGGDLREAVQGNAEAESHAKTYRTNMIAGVTTTLAGAVSAIGGGILYVASSSQTDSQRNATTEAIGGTLALSGVAAFATGMVLMLNAQPHLWDAVNAYNDGVEDGGSLRAYGWHVTRPPHGVYAATAPMGTAANGTSVGASPGGAPTEPPSERPNSAGAILPVLVPPPAPGAGPNAGTTPPPVPDVDLDLDVVEAK
jgi:hypothetical protein